ncbi:hypothetical protein RIF29_29442 [Crotalaria pallida]|uniref:Uncharacterized protein n=1 Tax=Crotalaria pallida TaxID=3830 RepID=A0AAN9HVX5_CROPI
MVLSDVSNNCGELENLLVAHEANLERIHPSVSGSFSVNVAHSNVHSSSSTTSAQLTQGIGASSNSNFLQPLVNSKGMVNGKGRSARNLIRSQLCSKSGHEAIRCWNRFDLIMGSQGQTQPAMQQVKPVMQFSQPSLMRQQRFPNYTSSPQYMLQPQPLFQQTKANTGPSILDPGPMHQSFPQQQMAPTRSYPTGHVNGATML